MTLHIFPFDLTPIRPSMLSRAKRLALAGVAVVTIAAAVGWLSGRDNPAAAGLDGVVAATGVIEVAETPFPFSPTSCGVFDHTFVAAGPGSNGFGDYWVSATESRIEILFNVESEVDTPPSDSPWFESGDIGWSSPTAGEVIAITRMTETRQLLSSGRGTLEISCG